MSIVDDLIENLVERNSFKLNGALTITLAQGRVNISGSVLTTMHDRRKNKDVLRTQVPVNASVGVGDIVIPVPKIP